MTSAKALALRERLKAEQAAERAKNRRIRRDRLAGLPVGLVWHVGRVAPGKDFAVERGLVDEGYDAFAPRLEVTVGDRARRRDVERPLFPGYVFFASPDGKAAGGVELRQRVSAHRYRDAGDSLAMAVAALQSAGRALQPTMRTAMGRPEVKGLFGIEGLQKALAQDEGRWLTVPDWTVRGLMAAEHAGMFDRSDATMRARRSQKLRKGDSVTILDGPFRDMIARVVCVKPGDRLKVLMDFLGGEVSADVALDSVAVLASP